MTTHPAALVPDDLWRVVAPLVPAEPRRSRAGRPRVAARTILAGLVYRLRTGCRWKSIPRAVVDGGTCHRRVVEWRRAGALDPIYAALVRFYAPDLDGRAVPPPAHEPAPPPVRQAPGAP